MNNYHPVKLSFEVAYTYLYVYTKFNTEDNLKAPRLHKSAEYSLNHFENKASNIDWYKLSTINACELNIPEWLPVNRRYQTSLSITPEINKKIENFMDIVSINFKENKKRPPYKASIIKLLFRAVIAEDLGILPYKNS